MADYTIPVQEISEHPSSYCDRMGRLFWWQGDLYRGIEEEYASFYRRLFETGVVKRLVKKKMIIETQQTDLVLEGYPLVLKHRLLPFVSYAHEWCPEMIKDAGLFIADLMGELATDGLTLADASTFDLLFDGSRPLYVDFTTIVDADYDGDRTWKYFRDDFYSYYIWPVRLAALGYGHMVRWLLAEYNHRAMRDVIALIENQGPGATKNRLSDQLISKARRKAPRGAGRLATKLDNLLKPLFADKNVFTRPRGLDLVDQLRAELERIELPPPRSSPVQTESGDWTPGPNWSQKQHSVYQILGQIRPGSVLDLGCGLGWYAQLAASLGCQVIAVDRDQEKISSCYLENKRRQSTLQALVMDASNPSPGLGVCNNVLAPATQRLRCELVLALSLVEQLVEEAYMTFEQIAETIANFSMKWALIEFIPGEGLELREGNPPMPAWYRLESFQMALYKFFHHIQPLPCPPGPRLLLLCEK